MVETLEQVLTGAGATGGVVVLFEYDRDPTAGTDFFRMQTGSSVVSYTWSIHRRMQSFVTDSQRDTDTGANSWSPAAFTPGNSIANHSVGIRLHGSRHHLRGPGPRRSQR